MPLNPQNLHVFLDCIITSERERDGNDADIVECVEEEEEGKTNNKDSSSNDRVVWTKRIQLNGSLKESAEQLKAQLKECNKVDPAGK